MKFELAPRDQAWKGRGRPRRQVPAEVKFLADKTYRTGHVQTVTINADEEEELRELKTLLNSYANSLGRRMKFQRDGDVLKFEMVDIKRKAVA